MDEKTETLLSNLKKLEKKKVNKNAEFLDRPEVKSMLLAKLREGVPLKPIYDAICDSGFALSFSAFRKWKVENYGVKKTKKKTR